LPFLPALPRLIIGAVPSMIGVQFLS